MKNTFSGAGRFYTQVRPSPAAPSVPDAEPLFHIGDTVMHPAEGLCCVTALHDMEFSGSQTRRYYTLKPAAEKSSSTIYLPVARGNAILRRLLDEKDILTLIHSSADYPDLWIEDSKQRKEAFSHILTEGNYAKIIRMIQLLRTENTRRETEGRKPCASDEAIRAEAERLVHQEFSYVLRLSPEDTVAFIARELENTGV